VIAVSALALSGCGVLGSPTAAAPAPVPTPVASAGMGSSVRDAGDIPDPCGLLSRDEVTRLTGRAITRIDPDGARPGDAARYCQWQQESGQLAVFLSRTTEADFHTTIDGAVPVDGVGQDAFALSGHLYVLYGTVQIDVYSRGGRDDRDLGDAKAIATVLIPRI
jgi:hypothetical protein